METPLLGSHISSLLRWHSVYLVQSGVRIPYPGGGMVDVLSKLCENTREISWMPTITRSSHEFSIDTQNNARRSVVFKSRLPARQAVDLVLVLKSLSDLSSKRFKRRFMLYFLHQPLSEECFVVPLELRSVLNTAHLLRGTCTFTLCGMTLVGYKAVSWTSHSLLLSKIVCSQFIVMGNLIRDSIITTCTSHNMILHSVQET